MEDTTALRVCREPAPWLTICVLAVCGLLCYVSYTVNRRYAETDAAKSQAVQAMATAGATSEQVREILNNWDLPYSSGIQAQRADYAKKLINQNNRSPEEVERLVQIAYPYK